MSCSPTPRTYAGNDTNELNYTDMVMATVSKAYRIAIARLPAG